MKTLLALTAFAVTLAGCVLPPPDYGRDSGRDGPSRFERNRDGDRDRGHDGHEDQGSMRPGSGYGSDGYSSGGRGRGGY